RPMLCVLRIPGRHAKTFGKVEPKLGMIRRAGLLVDQIVKQLLARRLIAATCMNRREIRRKRRNVLVILLRIIREGLSTQFPARPREIKRMFQKVFRCNVGVDLVKIVLMHKCAPKSESAYKRSLSCCKSESDRLIIAQRFNAGSTVIKTDRAPRTEEICINLRRFMQSDSINLR